MSAGVQVVVTEPPAAAAAPVRRQRAVRTVRIEAGGYTGADKSRPSLKRWNASTGGADTDLLPDLPTLRAHSRDLARNNPLAHGAVATVDTYAVGTGLDVQPQVDREYLGLSEEEADQVQQQIRRMFWACADRLDIERTSDFWQMQSLVLRATLESGDIFSVRRRVWYPEDLIGLKIQLVEADRVCNPQWRLDKPELAGGVERDRNGAPLGYHILESHPGDFLYGGFRGAADWKRVPAFDAFGRRLVHHHFRKRRPGQTRGVPYFAPVIEHILQLGRYTEAEVTAAVVNAFFTTFITSPADEDAGGLQSVVGENEQPDAEGELTLGSGLVADLAPGEDVKFADPKRPNVNFPNFAKAVIEQIAVGLELPYEVLVKHFNASYSAARAALLDAWKFYLNWRTWLAGSFCQPVYELVVTECVALGWLDLPGFFADPLTRRAWLEATWTGDSPGQIDPLKEVNAIEKRVDIGLTTLEQETSAYNGKDWLRNHQQRAKEARMRREEGLEKEPTAAAAPLVKEKEE